MRTLTKHHYTYIPTGYSQSSQSYSPSFNEREYESKSFLHTGPGVSVLGDPVGNYQTAAEGTELKGLGFGSFSLTQDNSIYEGGYSRQQIMPVVNQALIDSNDVDRFKIYAMSQLYQEMTGPQGLVILGEFDEAMHLLRNPLEGVLRLHKELREIPKRYKGSEKQIAQALANLHLQWNFGVKPMLADIKAGIKAYNKVISRRRYSLVKRSQSMEVSNSTTHVTNTYTTAGGFLSWKVKTTTTQRQTLSSEFSALYRMKRLGSKIPDPSSFGFGVESLVASTWELIPWSFVADYFINIGQTIEAHSVVRSEVMYGTFSFKSEADVVQIYDLVDSSGEIVTTPAMSTSARFERIPLDMDDLPIVPTFTRVIRNNQLRNLAALLTVKL
jgi:hypothetical protein